MADIFFYFYSIITLLSAGYIAFSDKERSAGIYLFLVSSSGMLQVFNAGYISFIMFTISAILFSFCFIRNYFSVKENSGEKPERKSYNTVQIVIISLTGALCASLAGSTIWQASVFNRKDITAANLGELAGEYFVIFLIITASAFLITGSIKWKYK